LILKSESDLFLKSSGKKVLENLYMNKFSYRPHTIENFEVSVPGAYSNLLGYQSVNVIDPSYSEFVRNFIVDDYYLTVYGVKSGKMDYSVQYTKKYADGRTIWYTEILNINQINDLFDNLESLDRLTERKMEVVDSVRNATVEEEIKRREEKANQQRKQMSVRKFLLDKPR
jgi:hypothetical protein